MRRACGYGRRWKRRLWDAGGVSAVAQATALSRTTIHKGLAQIKQKAGAAGLGGGRSRRPGAGRKKLTSTDPALGKALNDLVDPVTRGDPMSPLRWTSKSTGKLAAELTRKGHPISPSSVGRLLAAEGYSLQSVRKTREGAQHPERDAQFGHLNKRVRRYLKRQEPVISVDTKKKELVGDFQNKGREYQPQGRPVEVRVHDFQDKELGKVAPYGVYDVKANEGWVSVGVDHDTAEFAVATIRRWWQKMGQPLYPKARRLLITADCGGSNGSRVRLWKHELQKLADALRLVIEVCHLPPGTSKWNKIEHRLFSHITQNWRGRPLESREVIVNLIGATTTAKGLRIRAELDPAAYAQGIKITKAQMEQIRLSPDAFHGEWNYSILPRPPS